MRGKREKQRDISPSVITRCQVNCMHYQDVTLTPGLNPHAGIPGTKPGQGSYHASTN